MRTRMKIGDLLEAHDPTWTPAHLVAALWDEGYKVSFASADRWAKGENEPRGGDLMAAIARVLGCSVGDLFELVPDTDAEVSK